MASGRGPRIGGGTVDITADMTNYDNAMNALPARAKAKISQAMQGLKAEVARTKIDISSVMKVDTSKSAVTAKLVAAELARLNSVVDLATVKMELLSNVATREATALQNTAKAAIAAATAQDKLNAAREKQLKVPTYKESISALAPEVASKFTAKHDSLQDKIYKNREKLEAAISSPDSLKKSGEIEKLAKEQNRLAAEMAKVEKAAMMQANALAITAAAARGDREAVETLTAAQNRMAGVSNTAGDAIHGAGKKSGMSAMGFLFLSQAIEDAQYGFSAIVNNIPGVVMAFGGGPGLAGAMSIAAVGANLLISHWDKLSAAFGNPIAKTKAQEMEELGKKTSKTAEETLKLLNYERQRKNLDAQKELPKAITEKESKFNEAFSEHGNEQARSAAFKFAGGSIEKGVDQTLIDNRDKAANQLKSYEDQAKAFPEFMGSYTKLFIDNARSKLNDANKALAEAYKEGTDKFIGTLQTDEKMLRKFIDEGRKDPGKFFGGDALKGTNFLDKLQDSIPQDPKDFVGPQQTDREKAQSKQDAAARQRKKDEEQQKIDAATALYESQHQDMEKFKAEKDQEAARFADPMRDRLNRSMLSHPDDAKARQAEEADVRKRLKDAGKTENEIEELIPRILKNLRDQLKEELGKLIFEGATPQGARLAMKRDLDKKAEDAATKKIADEKLAADKASGKIQLGMNEQRQSQTFSSGNDLARSIIEAAANQGGQASTQEKIATEIQKQTIQLKASDEKLKEIVENTKMGPLQKARLG